jgi:uncharacterized integral membrane protein
MKANQIARGSTPLARDERAQVNAVALVAALIAALIAMVIATGLTPEVAFQASEAQANTSVTGATSALVGLLPILFVAVAVIGALSFLRET